MYFVRHSERLDKVNPDGWKASKRYKDNPQDTPISENGHKIAEKTIQDILRKDQREIGEIFSSPAERCIQTALEFQKQIKEKYSILIPIKIENGLIYDQYNIENYIKKFEKNKVIFGTEIKKLIFVDEYMKPNNITKRFGEENFDLSYKPIISIKEINANNTPEKQFNMRLQTVMEICTRVDKNKLNISVTNFEVICDIICSFCFRLKYNNELDRFREKYFDYNDYCFWVMVIIERDILKVTDIKNKDGICKITKKFIDLVN